jgi:hypothetical protein
MTKIRESLEQDGNEILQTGSQEIALPIVSDDHEDEGWLVITFKIPKGSRDGDIYDGYSMAEDYKLKQAEKAEKKRVAAEKKAAKIAKDKKMREEKAKLKAERG